MKHLFIVLFAFANQISFAQFTKDTELKQCNLDTTIVIKHPTYDSLLIYSCPKGDRMYLMKDGDYIYLDPPYPDQLTYEFKNTGKKFFVIKCDDNSETNYKLCKFELTTNTWYEWMFKKWKIVVTPVDDGKHFVGHDDIDSIE